MTRALILAAGRGTRLRPLTDSIPKCMVPLCGRPLVKRQIDTLRRAGIADIGIATGYCAQAIPDLGHQAFSNPRYECTNMVESLFCARAFFEDAGEDLVISYGDIVYQRDNLEAVLDSDADIGAMTDLGWQDLWRMRQENPLDDAETLRRDAQGHITELGKKPHSLDDIQGQYTGLFKVSARRISDLLSFYDGLDRSAVYDGQDFDNMYMTSFLQALIGAGWKVAAVLVTHGWLEVDTLEDLALYQRKAEDGTLDDLCRLD